MKREWELHTHESVLQVFLSAPAGERRKILRLLEALVAQPHLPGTFVEQDETGRPIQLTIQGGWMVAWWADSSCKEVRVLRLEKL